MSEICPNCDEKIEYLEVSQQIEGTLGLSDGTKTMFEMRKGESWAQWGNSTENLCLTVNRVKKLTDEWLEEVE